MRIWLAAATLLAGGAGVAAAGVDIHIDKASQRMTVSVDGARQYSWDVSTGKTGYSTPSGSFKPFRMEPDHFSREWDDAPMPHSIFFTYQGHAIHGSYNTNLLGAPASRGCVRLAPQNAARLYSLVAREGMGNTTITIAGHAPEEFGRGGGEAERRSARRDRLGRFWLRDAWR